MRERRTVTITTPQELTLGPDDFADLPQELTNLLVISDSSVEQQATSAVADFIGDLFQIPTVDGVMFSGIYEKPAPTTLSIGVLVKLDRSTPQILNPLLAIGTAEAKLIRQLSGFIPASLVYINTHRADIPTIKARLLKNSQEGSPGLPSLFVLFRRG